MSWKFTLFTFVLFTLSAWQLAGQSCGDSFFDSGGAGGTYQNNELLSWTFCPDDPGDIVVLDFTFVNVESCCDDLAVYSGSDTSTPLNLDVEAPETFISLAADGCLTVTWDSDFSVTLQGWEATISCLTIDECSSPLSITADLPTSTGAVVSWSQLGTIVDTWDLEFVVAGNAPTGTPTVSGVTNNPYTWTGGASGTDYEVYVRSQCDDGTFTEWIGPGTFTTVPGCGDSFFDSGGETGNYQNNEFETYTFCPDNPGDLVTLNFTFVDVESCCDDLSVFSGTGTANPLNLDVQAPESFTSAAADGCITVTWDSDGSVIRAGWAATVSCAPPPPCPNPTMLTVTTATSVGATIAWSQVGNVDTWDLEIIPAGTMPTGVPNVTDVMDNPYVWTDGDSGTEYDVYLRGQCEDEGEFTNWVGPISFTTVPGCGDNFYDPGGPAGQYMNNEFQSYTFCPDNPGEAIIIDFTFVNLENCCDDLSVYNGTGTGSPLNLDVEQPTIFISTAADGCLTVTFDSDGSVIRDGWEATITCSPCIPDPIILTPSVSVGFFDDSSVNILIDLLDLDNYQIEFDTVGFELGTGNTVISNQSSLVLNNLTEGTDYEFYLTNLCPDGQATVVLGPFPFSTIFSDDVGITEVIAPEDECGLGSGEPVRVAITNFGANPQTLFPLNYSVNGIPVGITQPNDGFFTGIISRDSSEIFEFDLEYDFDLPGDYTIQVWTEMATDDNLLNDTFTVVVTRFAPPLFEDFEAGVIPGYITTNFTANLYAPFAHNNETFVVGGNLFFSGGEMIIDLPVLGPVNDTDTLFFDYRYVNWSPGTQPTTNLTATDVLSVLVSTDCGETFDPAFLQPGTDHEPMVDFRTVAIPMAPFAGENVQIRIFGAYGSGGPDYWLDIDNINLPRCDGLGITANVTNTDVGLENGAATVSPAIGIEPFEYLWNTGETTATITDLPAGNYTVTITDRFGCSDQLTVTVDFASGINDVSDVIGEVVLAPNPTSGQSNIRAEFSESVDARVQVVNLLGQSVWQSPLIERVSSLNETVDLSQVPAGIYLVRIQAAGQTKTIKLMKS